MHLDMRLHSVLFLASSGLALANGLESNSTHSPSLTLAFSGSVDVAAPLPPIRIPGGVRIVEPITGGTFSGPALNAIVSGGLAFPSVLQNGTVQDASITIYGTTRDNAPFLVQVTGIGVPRQQFARVAVEVGGKEAGLMDEFLLATINPSADRRTVAVSGYVVG